MIKLSDFGVSKVVSNHTMTTTVGTAGYLAPEVLEGEGYEKSVDYWSIGAILYILLSGEPPFDDDDTRVLFEKIKRCEYSMKGDQWDAVSETAKDLIRHLLVKDPKERYDADKIMNHAWMKNDTTDGVFLENTFVKLKQMAVVRKIKRVSMAVKFISRLQGLNL